MNRRFFSVASLAVLGHMVLLVRGAPTEAQDASAYEFHKIAELGDPVPEAPGLRLFADFEAFSINDAGQMVFGTDLCEVDASTGECKPLSGEGVYMATLDGEGRVQLKLLLKHGDFSAECGAFASGGFQGRISLNEAGDAAFSFHYAEAPLGGGLYHYSHSRGEVRGVVCPGEPAPNRRGEAEGTFAGVSYHPTVNDAGQIVFAAFVTGADIEPGSPPGVPNDTLGLGGGVFVREPDGSLRSVVRPGDPGPGGGTFDFAANAWINARGDVAFGGHLTGTGICCLPVGRTTLCVESVFLRRSGTTDTAEIVPVALQSSDAPGGGKYRYAFGPVLNDQGEIAFLADLIPESTQCKEGRSEVGRSVGVFLYSGGKVVAVARPGDAMPGGGSLRTASNYDGNYFINDCGDVSFSATLDSMTLNIDGDPELEPDQGIFVRRKSTGEIALVARTGTEIPGIGRIAALIPSAYIGAFPNDLPWPLSGCHMNDRGQVLFAAALTDGRDVLLVATPKGAGEPCSPGGPSFVRGDSDANGQLQITDPIKALSYLFTGGDAPTCLDAADASDQGSLNISSAIYALGFLFLGGPAPPPPHPDCGEDPTPDELGCASFAGCG